MASGEKTLPPPPATEEEGLLPAQRPAGPGLQVLDVPAPRSRPSLCMRTVPRGSCCLQTCDWYNHTAQKTPDNTRA